MHRSDLPPDLVSLTDYERYAREVLPEPVFSYIAGGSCDEVSLKANLDQFSKYRIMPRVLTDVSQGSTRTVICGQTLAHPILLAPVAYQQLAHSGAEIATAQGAEALDTTMVLSTLSSVSLEDVAASTVTNKWFQLYFQPERKVTMDLVRRAEAANYSALVVTVDAPIQALHNHAERAGFRMPLDITPANLPALAGTTIELPPEQSRIFQGAMQNAPTWNDLQWLRAHTDLPIMVKGILHRRDAQRAIDTGADGIVVSNHGGRTLDRAPAALTALSSIRAAIGTNKSIVLDGGIRRGSDVFIALAMGADAVLLGRPQIYALAVAGALGVAHMLRVVREELEVTMALTGCATIEAIDMNSIVAQDATYGVTQI